MEGQLKITCQSLYFIWGGAHAYGGCKWKPFRRLLPVCKCVGLGGSRSLGIYNRNTQFYEGEKYTPRWWMSSSCGRVTGTLEYLIIVDNSNFCTPIKNILKVSFHFTCHAHVEIIPATTKWPLPHSFCHKRILDNYYYCFNLRWEGEWAHTV